MPTEWHFLVRQVYQFESLKAPSGDVLATAMTWPSRDPQIEVATLADRDFLATFDPQTVIALLDDIAERRERERTRYDPDDSKNEGL